MKAKELRKKFIHFFGKQGHKEIPSASLVPENDPSALFINSGMHPLVPFLLGEPHPLGKRLCSVQKCVRTNDIEETGDTYHHTFFEMLGNWSLGDYFKKEAINFSWKFLTKELNLEAERLSATVFSGDKDAPRDEEAAKTWQKIGIAREKIFYLGKKDNWWQVGPVGPCGPDTEIFYDTRPGQKKCGINCGPGCPCGKYFEIWNNVFMVFNRQTNGKLRELPQKNVDTGMGLERTIAVLNGLDDNYQTDLFIPIIQFIEKISQKKYNLEAKYSDDTYHHSENKEVKKSMRIIADHIRAAVFILGDGIVPANKEQGYILRRLIRRAVRHGKVLEIKERFTDKAAKIVIEEYSNFYPELKKNKKRILNELKTEEKRFEKVLGKGLREFEKIIRNMDAGQGENRRTLDGKIAFFLYETYGFPLELTEELAREKNLTVDTQSFEKAIKMHQKKSQTANKGRFAGGLTEKSPGVIKFHTVTHLLHQALRDVLGTHVQQAGSNITNERLRFDFTHPRKLTSQEIKKVEKIINEKIKENLPVKVKMMTLKQAQKSRALAFFREKYEDKVKVYFIGDYSKEVCAGPHIDFTGKIKSVRIIKEESCGSGKRRIYAV